MDGIFSILVDLINGTDEEFKIIVAYGQRDETPQNFKKYFNKNIKFIKIENFTRNINLKKDIKALKEIKQIIKKENPNIIHLHSSKAGVLGRLAIKANKIKMFYNPHGFSFLKQDDSKAKRVAYWLIEKMMVILNPKCTIIGCSKGEYLEAQKLSKNAICINNGIDIEKLRQETKDLKEKKLDFNNLKICTVGRIGYQKNPKLFNEIAQSLPKAKFTWIGEGTLRNELTSPNITITGWKKREDVLKILNEQDIFILTSLWEGLPISLLEAMYMKKICIVSNVIGNKDTIINGKNGYIAENLEKYNELIKKLEKDKKYCKVKNTTRKDIIKNFNVKKMIGKYTKLYKTA